MTKSTAMTGRSKRQTTPKKPQEGNKSTLQAAASQTMGSSPRKGTMTDYPPLSPAQTAQAPRLCQTPTKPPLGSSASPSHYLAVAMSTLLSPPKKPPHNPYTSLTPPGQPLVTHDDRKKANASRTAQRKNAVQRREMYSPEIKAEAPMEIDEGISQQHIPTH